MLARRAVPEESGWARLADRTLPIAAAVEGAVLGLVNEAEAAEKRKQVLNFSTKLRFTRVAFNCRLEKIK
jgi:hypothetical protein